MKSVEKVIGVSVNDFKLAIPALTEAATRLTKGYFERTHPKLKILDQLIIFSLLTFFIQLFYSFVVGQDPFNSLLAGLFCSLGQFALAGND